MRARWGTSAGGSGFAALVALTVAALLVLLGLWRGEAFWSTSDGVYAMTARQLLDGMGLYGEVAAAQPPAIYVVGAGLLAIDDSLAMLRAGLELAVLATALLAGLAVFRLTGSRIAAAVAAALTPFTPIALHENALLTPETLGAPLLLGLALLAASPNRVRLTAALGAAALAVKLSFLLPVLAIFLVAPARRGLLGWLVVFGALLAAAGTAVWGWALWGNIVIAQQQTGFTSMHELGGFLAQSSWSELPLVVVATGAWMLRARAGDPVLLRTLAAAAAAGLALVLSEIKLGSYVNTVHVAEAPLLVVGVCGVVWMARAGWATVPRVAVAAVAAAVVLGLAQSGSALVDPENPRPHTRPFAESGPRRLLSPEEVRAAVRAAEHCPAQAPYPGIQFVAFVAGRRVPGDQPDRFILASRYHRERAAEVVADQAVCPIGAPRDDPRHLGVG